MPSSLFQVPVLFNSLPLSFPSSSSLAVSSQETKNGEAHQERSRRNRNKLSTTMEPWPKRMKNHMSDESPDRQAKTYGHGKKCQFGQELIEEKGAVEERMAVDKSAECSQGFADDHGGCAKKADAATAAGMLFNGLFQVQGDSYDDSKNKRSCCIHPRKQFNTMRKLLFREMGLRTAPFTPELFRKLNTEQTMIDMYKDEHALRYLPAIQRKRSQILQILPIQNVVIVVSLSGLAAVFSRETNKMIRVLTRFGERTENVFYNKDGNCIIVTSTRKSDDFTEKHCLAIPLESIGTSMGRAIFEDEDIRRPGFVEFNDTNGKALIKQANYYKVFDLKNYSLLQKIEDMDVPRTITCRPEALLVIHQQEDEVLHLRTLSVEDGAGIDSVDHLVDTKVVFVETFHGKLLIQEKNRNLEIIDAKRSARIEVLLGDYIFVPLHRRQIFLTFQDRSTEIRDVNGAVIRSLDGVLWRSRTMECRVCTTPDQDALIFVGISTDSEIGCINVCCTRSGECLCKLQPKREVTSLSYNSDTNEIYAGSARGRVYVWSL